VHRFSAVEQQRELPVEVTADLLLALLRVGLRAEPWTGMRRGAPRPALGLSIRLYHAAPYEKPVDSVDKGEAVRMPRRMYKRLWARAKRKRLRGASVEVVELQIPRSLAKKLHAETPKGVGFKNFLMRLLSIGVGGKPLSKSVEIFRRRALGGEPDYLRKKDACPVIAGAKVGRNERCTCGSGRKWKHCCGAVGSERRC
jgi:hypothetical protein